MTGSSFFRPNNNNSNNNNNNNNNNNRFLYDCFWCYENIKIHLEINILTTSS